MSTAFHGDILPPLGTDTLQRVARLRKLAWLLDAALKIPGTRWRFGADAIIGLLPVGGTLVMTAISLFFVWEARQLQVPTRVLGKMLLNIIVEAGLDFVPVVGDVVDVAFKANLRNVELLECYFGIRPN
ncbi:hypothetical protein AA0472_0860 [Acetobacter estunensis NRIC 0472]|uniref:DUF4112 domain-containing protein n=1 Tax=Acetobacter estunensis TaxID=104097 RepID=A0A967B566_9PROT|nr:DUF4112 domain-containing protein [Acetobacter estunensis]NHO52624.1 DUF4112 domain-containing protein [Acetobacter estunensis]GBQ22721.1 hypothetical protein AA0472_0860 [Acetobacter estunensis NRIC 0472]